MATLHTFTTDFVSPILDDAKRAQLDEACKESHRTRFYDLDKDEVTERNHYTRENMVLKIISLDWRQCVDDIGLKLAQHTEHEVLDADQNPKLDKETGDPITRLVFENYHLKINVKREGLTDCEGTDIGTGSKAFILTREEQNRPLNEANYKQLMQRFDKFAFNGESMIKDMNGIGSSEQHRKTAKICRIAMGKDDPIETDDWSVQIENIHPDLSITIDTGKSNSGKDVIASDPEICPPTILETFESINGKTEEPEYLADRTKARVKVCGVTESAAKLVLLRLAGKNVNASLAPGNQATEMAHKFITTICPDIDMLATRCFVFLDKLKSKIQPCTPATLTAVLTLWYLRDELPINVLPRKDYDGGRALETVEPIRFDLDEVTELLNAIAFCDLSGRLHDWNKTNKNAHNKNGSKAVKFAQIVKMVQTFFATDSDLSTNLLTKECIGPQTQDHWGKVTFGGADQGPLKRTPKK